MPINLASPGIVVKEVDLTVGRVDPTSGSVGGLVGPFAQGPVELPTVAYVLQYPNCWYLLVGVGNCW